MRKISRIFIMVAFFCLGTVYNVIQANAEDNLDEQVRNCERKLSLDQFKTFALHNSPVLSEIDLDLANELSRALEIEVLTNPELEIEYSSTQNNLNGDNDSQRSLSLGQALKLSDFGTSKKVAALIRKVGDIQKKTKLLELNQQLNISFYNLFALQEMIRIASQAEQRASNKVSLIRTGVKKGLLSDGDEKLFDGEKYRLRAQSKGLNSNLYKLQAELSKLLGTKCQLTALKPKKLPPLDSADNLTKLAKTAALSDLARLNLLTELEEQQIRLVELDTYPQITPKLLYQHTNDGGDFFGVGITIPLPLWDRNQAAKTKSYAQKSLTDKRKKFLAHSGLEFLIRNLRDAAETTSEQFEIFNAQAIPAFEDAFKAQEKLYSEGKGNILQVWQTLRVLNEAQEEALNIWLESVTTRVQLSILVGEEL